MVILPSLLLETLCSNLGGIDPEKPYRATLILFFNVLTFILKSEGWDVEHFKITDHMYKSVISLLYFISPH